MGGFYIECGAADGEENSNTLFFEMKRNWKGNQTNPLSLDVFFVTTVVLAITYRLH